ncbi:MAG: response regulator [Treponema sp.]|nr:response regulator [Treponema sp.]
MENFKNINEAVEALERSKKMAEALNKTAAVFLSSNSDTFENMMTVGMGIIADAADLDRLNLWRNYSTPEGLFASQIYRWDKAAGGTTEPTSELKNVSYAQIAPEWEKIFKNDISVNSPVKDLTGNEGKMMNAYGAKSVFVTPIFIKNDFWGFLLYSDHHSERVFDSCCVEMMKSAAFLCANAVVRAEMEQEINAAHKMNQTVINSAPIGLTIFDENIKILDCNDEMLKMCCTTKQFYKDNFFNFSPEYQPDGQKSRDKAFKIINSAKNGEPNVNEWIHINSEGGEIPCELIIYCIIHDGKFTGLAYAYDLRNIKKSEMELVHAKNLNELQLAKLNLVIKSTKIGLWDMEINKNDPVNLDNTVVFSDDIRKMLGYTNEEDYPNKIRTWGEGLHPEDRDRAVDALTKHLLDKTGNTPYYLEFRLQRKSGEYIYIRASGETIRDNEGNAIRTAGALKDITEEKSILLNTEKLRAEAEAASMAKSNFLSNMSHEIRTPMNAIIGMTVIGKSAEDAQRKDYCLEKIENASQHLLGVINDILDMSKIEASKFELSEEDFDFEKMLQRVVSIIAFRADEKRQKLSVHIDKSIPRSLLGDDQRLAQVITNLLGNAVKFTPEEGFIKLDTRFLGKEDDFYKIQITVTDSGIGISNEQQEQLFQSFQQADSKTSRKFGGTGLGLVISKNIVELMGGQIGLKSELGKGSSFSFTFSVKRGTRKAPGLSEIGVNWGNVSIMAVDDDQEILDYFKDVLQGFGADCDTALSGEEALALIGKNGMYDIYFVDWKMPDMDGIKLAKELKARSKSPEHTIVIMISAAEWSGIADKAKKAGVDKFLSKPLFPSAIADVITEVIGSHHLPDETFTENNDIFKGYKILLAEDVDINREIVETLLEPTLLDVDYAENGKEAVAKFEKSPHVYDLILMDVQMPEMDGLEATRRIRAIEKQLMEKESTSSSKGETRSNNRNLRQQIPIIAMTANVFKEDVENCLNAGMNSHIGKPLDIDEFFRALRKYLHKRSH